MKKVTYNETSAIIQKFPGFEQVLEQEVKTSSLGYSSFSVSFFCKGLTLREFEFELEKADRNSLVINQNRKGVLKSLYPDVLYYSYNEELYKFSDFIDYLNFLDNTLRNNYIEYLICPMKAIIVIISVEYTDIYHFWSLDNVNINKIRNKTLEYNLNFFKIK